MVSRSLTHFFFLFLRKTKFLWLQTLVSLVPLYKEMRSRVWPGPGSSGSQNGIPLFYLAEITPVILFCLQRSTSLIFMFKMVAAGLGACSHSVDASLACMRFNLQSHRTGHCLQKLGRWKQEDPSLRLSLATQLGASVGMHLFQKQNKTERIASNRIPNASTPESSWLGSHYSFISFSHLIFLFTVIPLLSLEYNTIRTVHSFADEPQAKLDTYEIPRKDLHSE